MQLHHRARPFDQLADGVVSGVSIASWVAYRIEATLTLLFSFSVSVCFYLLQSASICFYLFLSASICFYLRNTHKQATGQSDLVGHSKPDASNYPLVTINLWISAATLGSPPPTARRCFRVQLKLETGISWYCGYSWYWWYRKYWWYCGYSWYSPSRPARHSASGTVDSGQDLWQKTKINYHYLFFVRSFVRSLARQTRQNRPLNG